MSASVRDAGIADLPGILVIYNNTTDNITVIWNEAPVDLADRQAQFDARARQGHPILVASGAVDEVLDYASYGSWRPSEGFRGTAEHSVCVCDDQRGESFGVQLLQALIERARAQGLYVAVAAIESGNAASIGLRRRPSFEISGQMPQAGQKFDRWFNPTFM